MLMLSKVFWLFKLINTRVPVVKWQKSRNQCVFLWTHHHLKKASCLFLLFSHFPTICVAERSTHTFFQWMQMKFPVQTMSYSTTQKHRATIASPQNNNTFTAWLKSKTLHEDSKRKKNIPLELVAMSATFWKASKKVTAARIVFL